MSIGVTTQFSLVYPLWQRILLGITASLLFLVIMTFREFVLSLLATSRGIRIERVTLFVFGGAPKIVKETSLPSLELLMAATGMLSNIIIAILFYILYVVLAYSGNIIVDVLIQWLAFIYLMLTLIHFIPGLPLDGGRLLRALLWKNTGNYERATHITGWIGWSIGILGAIGGILVIILSRQWFNGALLVFLGWVLQSAATYTRRQAR
jgi:Zn-dependent protease